MNSIQACCNFFIVHYCFVAFGISVIVSGICRCCKHALRIYLQLLILPSQLTKTIIPRSESNVLRLIPRCKYCFAGRLVSGFTARAFCNGSIIGKNLPSDRTFVERVGYTICYFQAEQCLALGLTNFLAQNQFWQGKEIIMVPFLTGRVQI
jgi:hypothetical protein